MIEQISIFDLIEPESRFSSECKHGSGFENGKVRIFLASGKLNIKEFAGFLREEYGTGGHSAHFPDGASGFTDYNSSGMIIREWKSKVCEKHNWTEVAREIKRLILAGKYLNSRDEEKIREIRRKNPDPMPKPRLCESAWI